MSKLKLARLLSVAAIAIAAVTAPQEARADDGICIGGGPGATQCSIQVTQFSCSVTCGTGYACCSLNGCHCINES